MQSEEGWVNWTDEHERIQTAIVELLNQMSSYNEMSFVVLNVISQLIGSEADRLAGGRDEALVPIFQGLCRAWSLNTFQIPNLIAGEPLRACGSCPACLANKKCVH